MAWRFYMAHPRPDVLEFALQHKPTPKPSRKARIIALMLGRCADCGYTFTGGNEHHFDFHHRDPLEKAGHVSALAKGSWNRALEEAEKCDLLCKFCHADRHQGAPKPRRKRPTIETTY